LGNTGKKKCLIPDTVILASSISDQHSFDTAPDPAFLAEYRSGSRVSMTKNWKKITGEENYNLPIPGPP
jgi:hypothetical protein